MIRYRDAVKEDFEAIVEVFLENMNLCVFTSATNKDLLRRFVRVFLAKDFQSANYMRVVESDGNLCGVLIGSSDLVSSPALDFDPQAIIKESKDYLSQSEGGLTVLDDLEKIETVESGESIVITEYDSELMFFCIDKNYRRNHLGSSLIDHFENFLKVNGSKRYSLHTDSFCSYQYYDRNGYKRIEASQSPLNDTVEHYIYTKEL